MKTPLIATVALLYALDALSADVNHERLPMPNYPKGRRYGFRAAETLPEQLHQDGDTGEPENVFDSSDAEEPRSLFQVTYYYKRDEHGTHIDYRLPYLELLKAGGPIEAIPFIGASPFRFYFPRLSVNINNPTDGPLLLDEARVFVKDSVVNQEPIIVLEEDVFALGKLLVYNMGWGAVEDFQIVYGIAPAKEYLSPGLWTTRAENFSSKKLRLVDSVSIDVRSAVDANLVSEKWVTAFGYILGAGPKIRFKARVQLAWPGPQAFIPSSATYNLKLEAGKVGIMHSVPIWQSIAPKTSDRFELRTVSDKSASYSMVLEIYDTSKIRVGQEELTVNIFRPRRNNRFVEDPNLQERIPIEEFATIPFRGCLRAVTINSEKRNQLFVFVTNGFTKLSPEDGDVFCEAVKEVVVQRAREEHCSDYSIDVIDPNGNIIIPSALGNLYYDSHRPEEALQAYEEAVEIYREMVQRDSEKYLPGLARVLHNLGMLESVQNQPQEARKEYTEALQTYRELAQKNQETYRPDVARTLTSLGIVDNDQGRTQEAGEEVAEALQTYRELAQKNPEAYRPDIAAMLYNLGILDRAQGRMQEAGKEFAEALQTYRELAQKNPETYRPGIAATLNYLGILDSKQGRMQDAGREFAEALQTYRELAQKNPETYRPEVARTLSNLGIFDNDQGRMEEARKEYTEALQIYETVAKQDPADVTRMKKLLEEVQK